MSEKKLLPEPYEFLELPDGSRLELRINKFEWGQAEIRPRYAGAPETKRIPVLRLYAAPGAKPIGAPWWDITSKTLQAQLRSHLVDLATTERSFIIVAHGAAPRKRFSLEIP